MEIAVTKKLGDAIGIKPAPSSNEIDPLFRWTANWIKTFDNRKEDMVVMVNNATRYTVVIYGVKRSQFKGIEEKMVAAIRHTFQAINLNPELLDEYLRQAGEISFAANKERQYTAWVNRQGIDATYVVGGIVDASGYKIKYNDNLGYAVSKGPVSYTDSKKYYIPEADMLNALASKFEKPIYKYRAFELLATLDLDVYKAVRRIIVPADFEFESLHKALQIGFRWRNSHLYDFVVLDDETGEIVATLALDDEGLQGDGSIFMAGRKLSDYLPERKRMIYTYDFGDTWVHEIELVRVIEDHNENSPYLLEASGQTPPEDVGGVDGFVEFREAILNKAHPDHYEMKEWAGCWTPELSEWHSRPQALNYTPSLP